MRYETKKKIVIVMHFFTWPFTLLSILDYRLRNSERVYQFHAMLLSLIPGKIGQYIRASFYMQTLSKSSYDLLVGFCSWFAHPTAEVGKNVALGCFTIIGTVTFDDNVLVGSKVSILSGKFQHGGGLGENTINDDNLKYQRVFIGKNTWLGENSVVMGSIEDDCVVSAGSVVTKPMKSNMIAIGNPARFLSRDYNADK